MKGRTGGAFTRAGQYRQVNYVSRRGWQLSRGSCHPETWSMAAEPARTYPSELPVVALRQTVVFPLTLQPLAVNRTASVDAVNRALAGDRLLFLALQSGDSTEDADPDDLRRVGTIAAVRQMARAPNGGLHIIVEGLTRARAEAVTTRGVSLSATVNPIAEPAE